MDNTKRNVVIRLTEFEARFNLRLIDALFSTDASDCTELFKDFLKDNPFFISQYELVSLYTALKGGLEKKRVSKETLDKGNTDNTKRNVVVKLTEFEAKFNLELIRALFYNDTLDCAQFKKDYHTDDTFLSSRLAAALKEPR